VEFFLTPGADSDTKALKQYAFDWPKNATITGDKAYNDYEYEDRLKDIGLHRIPLRKRNSKAQCGFRTVEIDSPRWR